MIRVDVDLRTHELYEKALALVNAEAGQDIPADQAVRSIMEAFVRRPPGRPEVTDSLYRIVVQKDPDTGRSRLQTGNGPIDLDPATAGMLEYDALVRDLSAEDPRRLPHGQDQPTPSWLRIRILDRDNHQCRCCGARNWDLHVHHIVFRSDGGRTVPQNLLVVCEGCHATVHTGRLRIEGTANDARFLDHEGRPLEGAPRRFRGARIVQVGPKNGLRIPHADSRAERMVTFDALPAEMDGSTWRRLRSLFRCDERRGQIAFEPGVPEEPAEVEHDHTLPAPDRHRPATLDTVIGQTRTVRSLRTAVRAAKAGGRPVHHLLLAGPPSLGKTTLAEAVAQKMDTRCWKLNAPTLTDRLALIGLLSDLRDGDVVFLDEVHALPPRLLELLYEVLERGRVSFPVISGTRARSLSLELPPVTVIGATTDPDRLPDAFRARFPHQEELGFYSEAELVTVVARAAAASDVPLTDDGARVLAYASRQTPRVALRLLEQVRERTIAGELDAPVGAHEARAVLADLEITPDGLGPRHREAMDLLRTHGPMGVTRLAARLGVGVRTFRKTVEPDLLRLGSVRTTVRGLAAGGG